MPRKRFLWTRRMRRARGGLAWIAALALIPAGCAEPEDAGGGDGWQGTVTTEGTRTIVDNAAGSVWDGPRHLEPQVVIGVAEGAEEYMFGPILGLAVTEDRVFAVDYQVPAVRIFDHDGAYLGDLGGDGEGPGEYQEPDDVAAGPDGRLYVREPRRARIHVYEPDGSEAGFLPMEGGFFTRTPLTVAADGTVYSPRLLDNNPGSGSWTIGMAPHTDEGPDDDRALVPTMAAFEPLLLLSRRADGSVMRSSNVPFSPEHVWAMASSGAMITGTTDAYAFEVRHPDGTITEIRKYWDPVAVQPGEADWWRELVTSQFRRRDPDWQWDGPAIPATKPPYDDLLPAANGDIWVIREGPGEPVTPCTEEPVPGEPYTACWRSAWLVDVFDAAGRYLGSVDLPAELGRPGPQTEILGDTLWHPVSDEAGTITIRRYRVASGEET